MAVLSKDRTKWNELRMKLPHETGGGGAAYLNHELYIFGGFPKYKALMKMDKNYKWKFLADMNIGRTGIPNSCLVWKDKIWVLGGSDGEETKNCLKSVERYDPKTDRWTQMPEMNHPRSNAAATIWNDKIIICGGANGKILESVECFDAEIGLWIEFIDLPTPLWALSLVSYENRLLVIGGANENKAISTVLEIENALTPNAEWKSLTAMKHPCFRFAGLILDTEIFVIGGCTEYFGLDAVQIFNGNDWRLGPSLPVRAGWVRPSAVIIPQHFADLLCDQK